jgi:hypothetical protein
VLLLLLQVPPLQDLWYCSLYREHQLQQQPHYLRP